MAFDGLAEIEITTVNLTVVGGQVVHPLPIDADEQIVAYLKRYKFHLALRRYASLAIAVVAEVIGRAIDCLRSTIRVAADNLPLSAVI